MAGNSRNFIIITSTSVSMASIAKLQKLDANKRKLINHIQGRILILKRFIVSATRRRRDIKIPLCLLVPHAEKFNIVSNDHGRTHKCDFSVFDRKFPLVKFSNKNQNCQFKLKFGNQTNSNMMKSMVLFILFVLDRKYHFWTNLVQKIKIASLSLNLGRVLIRTCRILWWCSLFLFQTGNTLFGQICFKKSKLPV